MCRWTGCLFELLALAQGVFFELPALATALAYFFSFFRPFSAELHHYFPVSRTADSLDISEQNIKELDKTIIRCFSKLGQGVFWAMRKIATGSGFDNG